ncbi:MAG: dihydrodipicolinate synthase family protein [Armatimonadetes bacterium]|nr:dihydrodipicolinate synthase family protein [Armatimonadota bacterium]
MVTPRANGRDEPDLSRLRELARWLLGNGVHGLFACSSTGEAPLLSWKQRRLVTETVAEAASGAVPVLAGVGAASTAESLRLARDARDAGATHLAVLPLHFVPVSQEELYGYFAAVADSVGLPILLYNFPARTGGQNIAPETAARLARDHNVIGLKDSGGDLANGLAYLAACGPDFALFAGSEALIYPTLMMGGAGTVCSGANVLSAEMVTLYDTFRSGDLPQAKRLQEQLLPWRKIVAHGTFPAMVKAGMALIGQPVGDPFLPTLPLSDEQTQAVNTLLRRIKAQA